MHKNIFVANSETIGKAAEIIKSGDVVAFPTETVYGLGANAFDSNAAAKIFDIKQRPKFDPLIVHIKTISQLSQLTTEFPAQARILADKFWPGPLTMVLPKTDKIPDLITSGLPTVAVRMPAHPIAIKLIEYSGVPIAAPSANRFGCISPTSAEDVYQQLGNSVSCILDGGRCTVGIESTIVSFADSNPSILRLGGITVEEIETLIGKLKIDIHDNSIPVAPGRMLRHYAPKTPLDIYENICKPPVGKKTGLLCLRADGEQSGFEIIEELSPKGDLIEAAANLYAAMKTLDNYNLDMIMAIRVPDIRLGRAINDRLNRASVREI